MQNSALRIATGCVRMSPIAHLHSESKILPVKDHLSLLSAQYLASCLQPGHPSHATVTADSGPRAKKNTLQSEFRPKITDLLVDGVIPDIKEARTTLHTRAVREVIRGLGDNQVLGARPPPINEEEIDLPRSFRTTLAQLRSGYCSSLNSFRHRIGLSPTASCPSCHIVPHTVQHVFSCPAHPTPLILKDLWTNPSRV